MSTSFNIVAAELRAYIDSLGTAAAHYVDGLLCTQPRRLELFVEGRPFPPFEVEIQPSGQCNLECRWCIGEQIQHDRRSLPDRLDDAAIDEVVSGIIDFRVGGLGVELVKLSGIIGEPLLRKSKPTALRALSKLSAAGIKVGLFTNGTEMTKDTWPTLCRLHYVNVSLDAGSKKYVSLKGRSSEATTPTFEQVIDNIRGLSEERRRQRSDLTIQPRPNLNNITVSYVVVPDNCKEIAEVVSKTENAGADAIRFKCDIGGKYPLGESIRRQAFAALREAQHPDARRDPPSSFRVTVIHDEADVAHETYRSWRKQYGCYYHLFATTIGSDGQVYLCDHNAIRGAQPLGDAVRGTLASVWAGSQRQAVVGNIAQTCCSSVCPPFGNAVNLFLRKVEDLAGVHGTSDVLGALRLLHGKLGSQTADAGASGCRPEGE